MKIWTVWRSPIFSLFPLFLLRQGSSLVSTISTGSTCQENGHGLQTKHEQRLLEVFAEQGGVLLAKQKKSSPANLPLLLIS